MRRTLALLLAGLLAAGCSSRTPVTDAVIATLIVYQAIEYSKEPHPFPSLRELYDFNAPVPTPPLAPDRKVVEQDCTKPPEDPTANLKCR
jgi:hypothetical protein